MIRVISPQEEWPLEFSSLKQTIMPAAPVGAYIHHIGSTAVPGLPAKDVIDIQLTVSDLSQVDAEAFASAGFKHIPGKVDHNPPGMSLPPEELFKLFFQSTGRTANLHIREKGRFNQRYPLLCRDYLRTHSLTASAYARIKQSLARLHPDDMEVYYEIKDPLFDIIMEAANDWAEITGWSEPLPD